MQQRRRILGIDQDWTDDHVWVDENYEEVDLEFAASLGLEWRQTRQERKGFTRIGCVDTWEHVTSCLTRKGCEDYIVANGHNLKDPRIYVESGYRNREWEQLRELIMRLGGEEIAAQSKRDSPRVSHMENPFLDWKGFKAGDYVMSESDRWPGAIKNMHALEIIAQLKAYGWEPVLDSAIRESVNCRPCEVLLRRIS